jgi:hypothetical protein
MKIVQILGGIGNQMFQYAFLIALRENFHQEVLMDTKLFKTYPFHNGFELDRVFNITAREATKDETAKVYHRYFLDNFNISKIYRKFPIKPCTQIDEPTDRHFMPELFLNVGNAYYIGYWQDRNYFSEFSEFIKKEFSFKNDLDSHNYDVYNRLLQTNSVSIHVRRGDYLNDPIYKGICGVDYYESAIKMIMNGSLENQVFVIFSNDIQWCKKYIFPLIDSCNECLIVDWNKGRDSYKDMQLMSACKANIIANSSFSYWGAYLNVNSDPIVIAPKVWSNGQKAERQLPNWKLI